MRVGLIEAETLETLRVPQHLASLLGQRGERTDAFWLFRHTHLEHLFSFFPSGNPAQGRQAKRQAIYIRSLAYPMARGHAEKRCDGISTDGQADVLQAEGRGGLQLERERGAQRLAQRSRRHRFNQWRTLGQGMVRAPWGFENLLARK